MLLDGVLRWDVEILDRRVDERIGSPSKIENPCRRPKLLKRSKRFKLPFSNESPWDNWRLIHQNGQALPNIAKIQRLH